MKRMSRKEIKELKKFNERLARTKEVLKTYANEQYNELCELESNFIDNPPVTFYSKWMEANFDINPHDIISLKAYAAFLDYPEKELLPIFESYYERNVKVKKRA